jgi:hypothetical protein
MVESGAIHVLLGALMGVAGAAPMLYVLHRATRGGARLDAGHAIACGVAPFMVLQLVLLAVALLRPEVLLGFGTAMSLAFLAVVSIAGLVAWRRMG